MTAPHALATTRARRNRRLAALIGLGAALAAAVPAAASSEPPTSGAATSDAAPGAFPVTIEHKFGEIELSAAPERIVTVGYTDQDTVLAFGIAPVAIREWWGGYPSAVWPWAQDEMGDDEAEVLNSPLNFEQIAALDPDLIVALTSGIDAETYTTLADIAPTLAQSGDYPDYGMPRDEQIRTLGTVLGQPDAADEIIAGIDDALAEARAEHPDLAGKTVAVAWDFGDGSLGFYGTRERRIQFLVDLGMVPFFDEPDDTDLSIEQITQLDTADVVIWLSYVEADTDSIIDSPVYAQMTVAVEGRDIVLHDDDVVNGAHSFASALSVPAAIDGLIPLLEAAADGDPTT